MKSLFAGILVIGSVYAYSTPSFAENTPVTVAPIQRTISVTGEAKEDIAPDQAIMSVSLVSRDKDLKTAKAHNDAMADRLVVIAKDYSVPKDKIAMSSTYISPEYSYPGNQQNNNQPVFNDYIISRSLRLTIDDLSKEELLLSAIVDAKIDQVNGVEFQLADREQHAAKLRVKAYENARSKADAIAQAAGLKLGPPITISMDNSVFMEPRPMPRPRMMMAAQADASVAPTLPGLVSLQESIQVTFSLE